MGAPKRFEVIVTKVIGFGFSVDKFPYAVSITIFIPLLAIDIGLGKPYTEL